MRLYKILCLLGCPPGFEGDQSWRESWSRSLPLRMQPWFSRLRVTSRSSRTPRWSPRPGRRCEAAGASRPCGPVPDAGQGHAVFALLAQLAQMLRKIPWDGICRVARERDVDLIVIGSHGYGGSTTFSARWRPRSSTTPIATSSWCEPPC